MVVAFFVTDQFDHFLQLGKTNQLLLQKLILNSHDLRRLNIRLRRTIPKHLHQFLRLVELVFVLVATNALSAFGLHLFALNFLEEIMVSKITSHRIVHIWYVERLLQRVDQMKRQIQHSRHIRVQRELPEGDEVYVLGYVALAVEEVARVDVLWGEFGKNSVEELGALVF